MEKVSFSQSHRRDLSSRTYSAAKELAVAQLLSSAAPTAAHQQAKLRVAVKHASILTGNETQADSEGEQNKETFTDNSEGSLTPGWNKNMWTSGDWASWVITGPFVSIAFSFFMFYTYGVPAGVLTLLICGGIDVATFYYNW
ncbi:hypothetical protein GUITHDRAFT_122829 [Guillardia theta CCMP2712]|uniref:Uncharacterized protein n=1 Tax=Guillardia theta (strain CCMP2712) TaxID=905079 RepID=L1I535_GUITC|nr:hypothetical protein GUITHDRAFT_122829 [Guillardia theta CCMP2712]EKX30965.1 hypothetical protein GUITHDRAFT_122829 [Guillardia theta CCMP2712]|eukprot:XP_005817945.1 hypothetical protein GUITHDRAFT_122829 [Guillardia theta CCMP2712]